MSATEASAPGKVILCGEHAVVYGYPAIALPLAQVRATARVEDGDGETTIYLRDLERRYPLAGAAADDPFALATRLVLAEAGLPATPPLAITIASNIPIAGGLGSGAATATALIRALARHLGRPDLADAAAVARLAFAVEQVHHGTPSGVDNTVVAYERPVYFVRGEPENRIEPFRVAAPITLLVADSGVSSPTRATVADVRRQWLADPARFDGLFAGCGRAVEGARAALEAGDRERLGRLMTENHALLREMTVSSATLDRLVTAALGAGALGAKLSGGGRGGNMLALVDGGRVGPVRDALRAAGARAVLTTTVG